ncbi:CBS domain-containing protein [Nymphaea thermarum]|nr:CBS domain-containing protein [Nymphaea thermarum]
MAAVFLYHVVGDLTVGKPELVEFCETETVESAIRALVTCTEGGIPVWKKQPKGVESGVAKQQRFVGIVNSMDIVAFLAKESSLVDREAALMTPVSEMIVPNNSVLKLVDAGTRLIDALEMMKQGVRRLLVPRSTAWRGMSKRFSILYNGKWLKNIETSSNAGNSSNNRFSSTSSRKSWCCLSREDVIRFLIGCLGALAPLPLSSISSLCAVTPNFLSMDASSPAIRASESRNHDPSAVAVVEHLRDGDMKIIGEISACKLWKCDYLSAAWSLANLSAGEFVTGVEDPSPLSISDISITSPAESNGGGSRAQRFSSRSIGFFSSQVNLSHGIGRICQARTTPLTCKTSSSLAAVMAQMLSHRATHVWVTADQDEEVLVGMVTYNDILRAVTRPPNSISASASV